VHNRVSTIRDVATIDEWIDVVLRDFRDTPAVDAGVEVIDFDPTRLHELAGVVPDAESWTVPGAPEKHRLLLRVGANVTSLDDLVDAPMAAAVEIASHLQDFVMDALNHPWPETLDAEGLSTVLEPRLGAAGVPEWAGRGVACRFGDLRELLDR
jgi:hypothetical protein